MHSSVVESLIATVLSEQLKDFLIKSHGAGLDERRLIGSYITIYRLSFHKK